MAGFETTNTTTMNTSNRFDKLQWLRESCSEEFVNTTIVDEMVNWMGEDDFNDFYDHLCSNWNLAKDFKTLLEYNGEQ
jgi:hypothetical protein